MFSESRFPEDISYGATGGPQFSTDTILLRSGKESRNRNWQQARMRYSVAFELRTRKQIEALTAFFYARGGKAEGFRFKDWADYQAKSQTIGEGDGVTTTFQLVKHYSNDSVYRRIITKPVRGTLTIWNNGLELTSGYGIDYCTGIITFAIPPARQSVLTADFEFDVPVRFDTDHLPIVIETKKMFSIKELNMIEIT